MRIFFAILVLVSAGAIADTAHADPYRFCADYGPGSSGETNCYFVTLEQCRATASGLGGYCRANGFYDGRPVDTGGVSARKSRHSAR